MATIAYRRVEGEYEWNPFGSRRRHVYSDDICAVEVSSTSEVWNAFDRILDQEWEGEWETTWLPTHDGDYIDESFKDFVDIEIVGLYGELNSGKSLQEFCEDMQLV